MSAAYNCKERSEDKILSELLARYPSLVVCEADIRKAAYQLRTGFEAGGKLLVCGNGGSAADSEHVVGELMKSFKFKRSIEEGFAEAYRKHNDEDAPEWLEGALPAISLVSQTSLGTAFCNDTESAGVFAQQVYGYGRRGDMLFAISTSGNSENVVFAAKVARARSLKVVSLTGRRKSKLSVLSDVCIRVPEDETFKVQELHLPVYHALCAALEDALFDGGVA